MHSIRQQCCVVHLEFTKRVGCECSQRIKKMEKKERISIFLSDTENLILYSIQNIT